MPRIRICDYTTPELEQLRAKCNFTPEEREYFDYRARGDSVVAACLKMHISESKAAALSRKVRDKINRIYRKPTENKHPPTSKSTVMRYFYNSK